MKRRFAESELIINSDGSVFHLHLKPEQLADKVILVGDPGRVETVAKYFDNIECEVSNREFRTITGTYHGKRISVQSTGIGCDNIDIVVNELDALANIDFTTREEKDKHRQLSIVRIGTCVVGTDSRFGSTSRICAYLSGGLIGRNISIGQCTHIRSPQSYRSGLAIYGRNSGRYARGLWARIW